MLMHNNVGLVLAYAVQQHRFGCRHLPGSQFTYQQTLVDTEFVKCTVKCTADFM